MVGINITIDEEIGCDLDGIYLEYCLIYGCTR
jgi:hypothetical protein